MFCITTLSQKKKKNTIELPSLNFLIIFILKIIIHLSLNIYIYIYF